MANTASARFWIQWLPACGIVAAVLYYALFIYRYAMNVPFQDDIYDVLQFITRLVQAADGSQVAAAFLENYNEHRTMASRLLYYLAFSAEGEVNFRTLIFVANLALPLLLFALYLPIRRHSHALLILLPAALLLFQPRFHGLSFFSMSAFAYLFVYLYGFASLLCLRHVTAARFLAAVGFAALGSVALASGQIIWVVGLASLLHQAFILRRCSPAFPLAWLLCAVLLLIAWHIDYTAAQIVHSVFDGLLVIPSHFCAFFLTLTGAAFSNSNVVLAAVAGALMLCLVGWLTLRDWAREDVTLLLFAWYIVLSLLSMALGRAMFSDLSYALESRFAFPPLLLLATLVVLVLSRRPSMGGGVAWYAAAIALAGVHLLFSYQIYPREMQLKLAHQIRFYNGGKYWVVGHPIPRTQAIVEQAIALGIYRPITRPVPKPVVTLWPAPRQYVDAADREPVAGK